MTSNMRCVICFLVLLFAKNHLYAQNSPLDTIEKDSVIIIEKKPEKGFFSDYILFIPKGLKLRNKTILLVEPNNTGKLSDSMEVHKKYALELASISSVGNNISTELRIPLLVPVFPRPASKPFTYTHALDRDVMLETSPELKRLDLQLVEMIRHAKFILQTFSIQLEDKIFMSGFSASATFANRFSFLHPDKVQALAIGGFNGILMFPHSEWKNETLIYPIGTHDFEKLFNQVIDFETYKTIPQFIYMGQLDENDAVQFDDAYSENEREIITKSIGATIQQRFVACQNVYLDAAFNTTFKTYNDVGHWTTSQMNLDVILFFLAQMKKN